MVRISDCGFRIADLKTTAAANEREYRESEKAFLLISPFRLFSACLPSSFSNLLFPFSNPRFIRVNPQSEFRDSSDSFAVNYHVARVSARRHDWKDVLFLGNHDIHHRYSLV